MTREELEMMLGEMDPEERELAIAADDAADRLWAYKLRKEFGVEVVCNPDGDRTKVMIDGVVMDHEQFSEWYASKQLEKILNRNDDEDNCEECLPTELEISYDELSNGGYVALPSDVKRYLRREFGYCLARDNNMTIDIQDDDEMVYVHNIAWGRKLTTEELNNLR